MFRKMRREKQALSREECVKLLKTQNRGVLAVQGDDGYPYCFPINHYYDEAEGVLYFHGGKAGHRVDAIKKDPKVSYCVYGDDEKREGDWAYYVKSVIVFGKARLVEGFDKTVAASLAITSKFPVPDGYAESEVKKSGAATLCVAVDIEHMSGKLVHEA